MPHWMLIVLFASIIAALSVIVKWEIRRLRRPPGLVPGTVKRYLASEASNRLARVPREEGKRGFDD